MSKDICVQVSERDRVAQEERSQKTIPQRLPRRDRACLTHRVHSSPAAQFSCDVMRNYPDLTPTGKTQRSLSEEWKALNKAHSPSEEWKALHKMGIILMTVFGWPSHRVRSKGSILF